MVSRQLVKQAVTRTSSGLNLGVVSALWAWYDTAMSINDETRSTPEPRELAIRAALAAGKFLLDRFHEPHRVTRKGKVDLVTEADTGSERLIAGMIAQEFPHHQILGEESGTAGGDAEHLWVIDPLDGTSNYAHGYPVFSVSIAYRHKGQTVVGVVFNPLRDELFVAERGKGAYLGDQRLSISHTGELVSCLVATGFPYDRPRKLPKTIRVIQGLAERVLTLRANGSAAVDLCYVAAGRTDAFWENDLSPWDTAAGSLMVEEAGGRVSDGQGDPYDIFSREILATNGLVHEAMLQVIAAAQD